MAETLPKEHLKEVAQTILNQIITGTTWDVRGSWGMNNPRYTQYQDYPALIFSVNGFLFSGEVIVALDEGLDVYRLYLWDKVNEPQLVNDNVYCDELGDVIDRHVEKGESEALYNQHLKQFMQTVCL